MIINVRLIVIMCLSTSSAKFMQRENIGSISGCGLMMLQTQMYVKIDKNVVMCRAEEKGELVDGSGNWPNVIFAKSIVMLVMVVDNEA